MLGLVGASGSGKTTLARQLVASHGFTNLHMGRPIKEMLLALGLPERALTGDPQDRERPQDLLDGRSARYALSTLGTEWGRNLISENLWSNAVRLRIEEHARIHNGTVPIVIDDLRFPSDWKTVQSFNGKIVTVRRPSAERHRSWLDRAYYSTSLHRVTHGKGLLGWRAIHESEFHWRDAPSTVELWNTGSIDELVAKVLPHCP